MEKIGALCPTGWVYKGQGKDGGNLCQNYYNIDVPNNDTCYNIDTNKKLSSFPLIKNWQKCQDNPGNCGALKKRCRWIKKCGPQSHAQNPTQCNAQGEWTEDGDSRENPFASWIGVANKC